VTGLGASRHLHTALPAAPVAFTAPLEDGSAKATILLSTIAASRDGQTIDPPIPDLGTDGDFATAQMKVAGETTVTLELGFDVGDLDVQAITYTPAGSERAVVVWGDGA
jgi:hypothetical protein